MPFAVVLNLAQVNQFTPYYIRSLVYMIGYMTINIGGYVCMNSLVRHCCGIVEYFPERS